MVLAVTKRSLRRTEEPDSGVVAPNRDYRKERPARDEVYAVLAGLFDYEPSPIDANVEAMDDAYSEWRIEHVSYAASYGRERVPAVL